jgi:Tfp pilus assembly protein PilF
MSEASFSARPTSEALSLAIGADLLAHDRNDDRARTMLEEALQGEPNLAPALETMSLVALHQHRVDEAINFSEQALAWNPKSFRANDYRRGCTPGVEFER